MSRSTYSRFVTITSPVDTQDLEGSDHVASDDLKSHIDDALAASYDSVAIFLANELWKARWQRMCLSQSDAGSTNSDGAHNDRLKSRVKIENTETGQLKVASGPKDAEILMEAELWRAGGGFQREELNITRNGEQGIACGRLGFNFCCDIVDHAEYVVGFASDWLELDSSDEGVRYDSEIVSQTLVDSILRLKSLCLGASSRTPIRVLLGPNKRHPPLTSSRPTNIILRTRRQRLSFLDIHIRVYDSFSPYPGLRCSSRGQRSCQGC